MDIGLNTANLAAIVIITLLTLLNTFGVKLGASVQNVFTSAKVLALAAVVLVGLVAKNSAAIAANFGPGWHNFWAGAGWHTTHAVQVGVGGPTAFVGLLTVVAVVQVGSLFSADAWNNVTFTAGEIENPRRNLPLSLALGTGVVLLLYIFCNFVYLSVLPMAGLDRRSHPRRSRHSVRHAGPRSHSHNGIGLRRHRRQADGRRHPHLHLRLRQRNAPRRSARLLRHGPRRPLLPLCR